MDCLTCGALRLQVEIMMALEEKFDIQLDEEGVLRPDLSCSVPVASKDL